ncbi:MAG: glutaminase A [Bacillota bacterium]|nr:glutaminase A [Bacillota bacterium]
MKEVLERAYEEGLKYTDQGQVATYIPELAKEDPTKVAIAAYDQDGSYYEKGEVDQRFSIQSVSKVITYILCLEEIPAGKIQKAIGVKPTALPFNSVLDLELGGGKPRNPLVNAGAIAATALLYEKFGDQTFDKVLDKIRDLAEDPDIVLDENIYNSERSSAFTNFALFNLMVSRGNLSEDIPIQKVADAYFKACSVLVNVKDLARIGYVLANDGFDKISGQEKFSKEIARRVRTVMAMGGMYDYCGEFAQLIGLPAKSGVGGGIMTASKEGLAIATYCPGLDDHGNSFVGIKMLEAMAQELEFSIY